MNEAESYPFDDYRGLGPPLGPEAAGQRTDRFLASTFPFHSRQGWQRLCWLGHILVDGRPVRPGFRLKGREQLHVFHPLGAEPDVDESTKLLALEDGVLAVFKPANLPMHEAGPYRRKTLRALVAQEFGAEFEPVHRLDRETSGVVIFGATPTLRRCLSLAFENGQVGKRYQAVAMGACPWDKLRVVEPLALAAGGRPKYVAAAHGATAMTDFSVVERGAAATLLEAIPRTGRTNQIRAHAAWAGYPLWGDKVYHPDPAVYAAYCTDGDSVEVRTMAGYHRHALHAAEVSFTHPGTNRLFVAEAPFPADLSELWDSLKG